MEEYQGKDAAKVRTREVRRHSRRGSSAECRSKRAVRLRKRWTGNYMYLGDCARMMCRTGEIRGGERATANPLP